MHLKNKLIDMLLKKDQLVAVPISWQQEYAKLCGAQIQWEEDKDFIMNAYNELLRDYYHHLTVAELKEELKGTKIELKSTATKEEMADALYEEFKMRKVTA